MFVNLLRPLLLCKPFPANDSDAPAGLGCAGACSKAASSDFVPGKPSAVDGFRQRQSGVAWFK
jgi:hypothetical protein